MSIRTHSLQVFFIGFCLMIFTVMNDVSPQFAFASIWLCLLGVGVGIFSALVMRRVSFTCTVFQV